MSVLSRSHVVHISGTSFFCVCDKFQPKGFIILFGKGVQALMSKYVSSNLPPQTPLAAKSREALRSELEL